MGIYNRIFHGTVAGALKLPGAAPPDEASLRAQALRVLRAHVMIADRNDVIVAMNESVERMLRAAENDIRRELPDFAVDRLIGSSMDAFHRNPAHQKRILAGLTAPHEAVVRIGGREFSLVATPLHDGAERIGTVIEWQDNTEANALRAREQEQRRKEKAKNDELAIITTALDSVSSNVMMADAEGRIFFANKAVLQLLRKAEADMRAVLPDFAADTLVGRNFDAFHARPEHQKNLLARLTQPYETDISVGVRRFHLIAAPVFGKDGARLATVVEWQDRTAEILMERDVENTIQSAIHGELDARIDSEAYHGFLARIAAGINQLLDVFDTALREAAEALHAMANGDLYRRIEGDYAGRYADLKADINGTIDRLRGVVRDIGAATAEVRNVSQELRESNASLSQRTEQQAASLEETSAAMEELTRAVEQNTQNASTARSIAHDARHAAEEGGRVLERAVGAMEAISESSRKIDEIIGVIDGIAFQTNLLALNAAVEAARAGDQGRGFAVVAGEVRNLASMSGRAAKEIRELIRDSGTRVREGAALVDQSGETLTQIIQAVKKVNGIVEEIAASSNDQARGIAEINRAVQEMDATTQRNAAMVEEAANASDALFRRAEALNDLMAFFAMGARSS